MRIHFNSKGWASYLTWTVLTPKTADGKTHEAKLRLLEDIRRHPFQGLGKPEPPKGNLPGWWSRRITSEHRLVYRVKGVADADQHVEVMSCRGHCAFLS